MRTTWGQPASRATLTSATVFDELALPITTTASDRDATTRSAACRFVVAKHKSPRVAVHRLG